VSAYCLRVVVEESPAPSAADANKVGGENDASEKLDEEAKDTLLNELFMKIVNANKMDAEALRQLATMETLDDAFDFVSALHRHGMVANSCATAAGADSTATDAKSGAVSDSGDSSDAERGELLAEVYACGFPLTNMQVKDNIIENKKGDPDDIAHELMEVFRTCCAPDICVM